jgi:hypothetical protein
MHPVWIVFLFAIAVVPRTPVPKRPKIGAHLDVAQTIADPRATANDLTVNATFSPVVT